MIIENEGKLSVEQLQEHFERLLDSAIKYPEPAPVGDGLSDELDVALALVTEAVTGGGNVQEAVDNAWTAFYELRNLLYGQ